MCVSGLPGGGTASCAIAGAPIAINAIAHAHARVFLIIVS
jgi:hypothetical protein